MPDFIIIFIRYIITKHVANAYISIAIAIVGYISVESVRGSERCVATRRRSNTRRSSFCPLLLPDRLLSTFPLH